MRKLRAVLVCSFFLVCHAARAQAPDVPLDWNALAKKSPVIAVGVVMEGNSWVIQPKKVIKPEARIRATDGPPPSSNVTHKSILIIQNPSDYVVGEIYRFRVDEAVKADKPAKSSKILNVFVPGMFPTEGQAALVEKQKYILFLSPLKANDKQFSGTMIMNPRKSSDMPTTFDPTSNYSVVEDGRGVVALASGNTKLLDEIKSAAK